MSTTTCFWMGFSKILSSKIVMSGRVGVMRALDERQVLSQVNLFVNLFSKLYVTFILQWIAFIW